MLCLLSAALRKGGDHLLTLEEPDPAYICKRSESDLVCIIVQEILANLNREPWSDPTILVGIESRIQKIEALLCLDHSVDVSFRAVGIWGLGGIGKTALARAVFDRLSSQFEAHCFLRNIREESKRHGLNHLRDKLVHGLLNDCAPSTRSTFVYTRLSRTKVHVVLDDVDDISQVESLVADQFQFAPGSRFIITTTDMQLLRSTKKIKLLTKGDELNVVMYEVMELNSDEALQLFNLKAFKDIHCKAEFREYSRMVVDHVNGFPLALTVFGFVFLHCNSKEEWESELKKLKKFPNKNIQNVLKVAYDGLEDNEREIFLDIVCFHVHKKRDDAKRELNGRGLFADRGIEVLVNKSLLSIKNNRLRMHSLIQQMGREIVLEQCLSEPGRRSRLYSSEDARHVLGNDTGTETVQGISVDMDESKELNLAPQAFIKLHNLRYWKFSGYSSSISIKGSYPLHIPNALGYLCWSNYPLRSFPSDFCPDNLVELHMQYSKLQRLWHKGQNHKNLKVIDLSYSPELVEVPCLNVVNINLGYSKLVEIPSYFENLNKLTYLDLSNAGHLRMISKIPHNIKVLYLGWTAIQDLPTNIWNVKSLEDLSLNGCPNIKSLSEILEPMECLKILRLRHTEIKELPSSIRNLVALRRLDLVKSKIESVPPSIEKVTMLRSLDISDCEHLQSLPKLPYLLEKLNASNCRLLKLVSCSTTELSPEFCQDVKLGRKENFLSWNCSNMDEKARKTIMDEAESRIIRMATALSINREQIPNPLGLPSVTVVRPGNEIPKRFSYQTEGSSMNLNLPIPWSVIKIGFSLCVVVEDTTKRTSPWSGSFKCKCTLLTNNGESHQLSFHLFESDKLEGFKADNSHHVFLWFIWYDGFEILDGSSSDRFKATKASFDFYPEQRYYFGDKEEPLHDINVERCGVSLIPTPIPKFIVAKGPELVKFL
ncbi:hypothetical protein ACLB2K_063791 [Fragaria x ananassa]